MRGVGAGIQSCGGPELVFATYWLCVTLGRGVSFRSLCLCVCKKKSPGIGPRARVQCLALCSIPSKYSKWQWLRQEALPHPNGSLPPHWVAECSAAWSRAPP